MTQREREFAIRVIQRKNLSLVISIAGVVVGLGLLGWLAWERWAEPGSAQGYPFAVVVLILLNARRSLREHRFARLLEKVDGPWTSSGR